MVQREVRITLIHQPLWCIGRSGFFLKIYWMKPVERCCFLSLTWRGCRVLVPILEEEPNVDVGGINSGPNSCF